MENFLLKLPSFEYHNELLTWRELLLQVRKDALFVLMRNAGSLLVEKMKRIGQSSLPEDEDPMNVYYKLEELPDDPLPSDIDEEDEQADGEEKREEEQKKMTLLFGDLAKKKK